MKKLVLVISVLLVLVLAFTGCQKSEPASTSTSGTTSTTTSTASSGTTSSTTTTTSGTTTDTAKPIKWKMSTYCGDPDPVALAMGWWCDEVESRSGGRIEIQRFWNASLCPPPDEIEGIKGGLFEVCFLIPSAVPSKLPISNMQFLPCLMPLTGGDYDTFEKFEYIQRDWAETTPALVEEYAKWDAMITFSTASPEYYRLIGNVRATTLEDLNGTKIRAVGGVAELLQTLGAATVATGSTEIYDALSKGTVELACHASSMFVMSKLYEVSDYYIPSINLGNMGGYPVIKKSVYDGLPDDLKQVIDEVNSEATDRAIKFWADAESGWLSELDDSGIEVIEFSPASQQEIQEISVDHWYEYVDKLEGQGLEGKAAFNSFQDSIAKYIDDFEPTYMQ